jgi:hypothetical protein
MFDLSQSLPDGLSVLPMNAAVVNETEHYAPVYEFLLRARDDGVKFMSLYSAAVSIDPRSLRGCEVITSKAFGMTNEVASQGEE